MSLIRGRISRKSQGELKHVEKQLQDLPDGSGT